MDEKGKGRDIWACGSGGLHLAVNGQNIVENGRN